MLLGTLVMQRLLLRSACPCILKNRRVQVRDFFLVVSTFPLSSSALAFPFRSGGATAKFFSEHYRTRVIRLLFYVHPRSSRPRCLLLRLLLLLLLSRSRPFSIAYKLYVVPLVLAYLLQRW